MSLALALLFGARGGGLLLLRLARCLGLRVALSAALIPLGLLSLLLILILLLRTRGATRLAFGLPLIPLFLRALALFLAALLSATAATLCIRHVCGAD